MKEKLKNAYMDIAKRISECSSAKRLKVGSICVKNDKIISLGYNGTPSGWSNICEDENNNTISEVIHAEVNMLTKLAKCDGGAEGSSVFVTHSPCIECAKMIYQSGVKKVYYNIEYRSNTGLEFLRKCRIEIEKI